MSDIPTLNNLKQKQFLLRIMIFTLVTVMAWVGFGLFHSQTKTTLPPELSSLSQPLNPNLDQTVLDRIQAKRSIPPAELNSFPIYVIDKDGNGKSINAVIGASAPALSSNLDPAQVPSPSPASTQLPATPQPSPSL